MNNFASALVDATKDQSAPGTWLTNTAGLSSGLASKVMRGGNIASETVKRIIACFDDPEERKALVHAWLKDKLAELELEPDEISIRFRESENLIDILPAPLYATVKQLGVLAMKFRQVSNALEDLAAIATSALDSDLDEWTLDEDEKAVIKAISKDSVLTNSLAHSQIRSACAGLLNDLTSLIKRKNLKLDSDELKKALRIIWDDDDWLRVITLALQAELNREEAPAIAASRKVSIPRDKDKPSPIVERGRKYLQNLQNEEDSA